jgi:hypothetical protein
MTNKKFITVILQEVLGRTNSIPSFVIQHEPHRKFFFAAAGTSVMSGYLATTRGYTDRPRDSPSIRYGWQRKLNVKEFFFLRVFVAAGTCLSGGYLSQKGEIHLIEPLLCNDMRDTHADTEKNGSDF